MSDPLDLPVLGTLLGGPEPTRPPYLSGQPDETLLTSEPRPAPNFPPGLRGAPAPSRSSSGTQHDIPHDLQDDLTSQPESVRNALREMAKNDSYFLNHGVLGKVDLTPHTHGPLCLFVQNERSNRRLILYPRSHFKSTIVTEGESVRLALNDPDHTAILIINKIALKAAAMMQTVKEHFEKGKVLRWLFPELCYDRYSGPGVRWNTEMAFLPRNDSNFKEPTWMCAGTGASITGWHFSHLFPDDIIDLEDQDSPALMDYAKKFARNLQPLLIQPSDSITFVGTRYAVDDVYADIINFYGEQLAVFTRACREWNGKALVPIFPERFTNEWYDHLQLTDPEQYYGQYENNPLQGGKRDFTVKPKRFWINSAQQVCFEKGDIVVCYDIASLDIVILADPAGDKDKAVRAKEGKGDHGGILAIATGPRDEKFVLCTISKRFDPSAYVDELYDTACRWNPRVLGIEQVGLASTLHYLEKKMIETKRWFATEPLRPGNRNKQRRIRERVGLMLGTGNLYILDGQEELRTQLDRFPNIKEDALLDLLAYDADIAQTPDAAAVAQKTEDVVQHILATRSSRTGY